MADEVKTEEKPAGGNKKMMIALIGVIVVLLIAIGVGAFLYFSGALNSEDGAKAEQNQTEKKASASEEEAGPSFQADVNDLVLNITDAKGNEKLMKLSFSLKASNEGIPAMIETNKAEIIDAVIALVSSRSAEELLTLGGKELLKEELLEEVNKILNEANSGNGDYEQNSVKKLFFTSFVLK